MTRPREPDLARAVVSALMQVGPSFEVVLVLDGHCPLNTSVAEACADPKLRVIRHERPRGRGAARAAGVEAARGAWICGVDADDWILPSKQQQQWEFLQQHQGLDLVSMGLLVVGRDGALEGVRSEALFGEGLPHGRIPPLPTPSMMVRASVAKAVQYDPLRWAGEDRDFLLRVLPGRRWAYMPSALYAYEEYASHSLIRCLESYQRRFFLDAKSGNPWLTSRSLLLNSSKALAATAAFTIGAGDMLVRRRSEPPTEAQRARYEEAKRALEGEMERRGLTGG